MASSKAKKRGARRKKGGGAVVPPQRKKEVLGLIVMVLALLVGLALVSYDPADNPLAREFSLEAAFNPGRAHADNALGLIGASIAWLLVPNFLGYSTLLSVGLLLAWGWVLFRQRQTLTLPLLSGVTIVVMLTVACLFGWLSIVTETDLGVWSGAVGLGTAAWMQHVFGAVGSIILLLLLLAVSVLLTIDRDIQRSLDRVEEVIGGTAQFMRDRWDTYRTRSKERREERAAARAERRAARERKRKDESEGPTEAPRQQPKPEPKKPEPAPARVQDGRRINDLFRTQDEEKPEVQEQPAPRPAPQRSTPAPGEPELRVQARVEEEKADTIEREPELAGVEEDYEYEFPPIDLLDEDDSSGTQIDYGELEENKRILLDKLDTYNIEITDINAIVGPTVTMYELTPAPGVKISRITALEDDLAMAMAARGIRMIAPIPGKSAIGVEIPNRHRELVPIRDVLATAKFRDARMELPIAIGKTIEGEVFIQDLTKMPHLLIAGATGSGKSVGLNTIIASLLYSCHPANLKFVMIDPKKIELQQYALISDHFGAMPEDGVDPIITDVSEALAVFQACEKEMERRYDLLSKASVRGIKDYNKRLAEGRLPDEEGHQHLPYIVVIVDELADLMMTAGKDIEGPIARLAQMARAVGIHLVLATQRPSVDVITGLIKANFPARVAYQVASKVDSRTILDQNGAEGLVGNGDMLFLMGSHIVRLQGPFVSVEEVDRLMEFIADQPGWHPYELPTPEDEDGVDEILGVEDSDDLFEEAARIIVRSQQGSVSLLQRKLSVGYTRAARIVDQLEEAGIVGPFVGSKAREVLVEDEMQLERLLDDAAEREG